MVNWPGATGPRVGIYVRMDGQRAKNSGRDENPYAKRGRRQWTRYKAGDVRGEVGWLSGAVAGGGQVRSWRWIPRYPGTSSGAVSRYLGRYIRVPARRLTKEVPGGRVADGSALLPKLHSGFLNWELGDQTRKIRTFLPSDPKIEGVPSPAAIFAAIGWAVLRLTFQHSPRSPS